MSNKIRPSPSESATLFKIGTVRKGGDGNDWIVTETSTGTHRWSLVKNKPEKLIHPNGSDLIVNRNKFYFNKIRKFKKVGMVNMTGKIGVGDWDYRLLNLIPGIYNIYLIDDNLAIFHSDITINKELLKDIEWVKKYDIGVDGGTYGFYDVDIIKKINKIYNMPTNSMPLISLAKDTYNANTKYIESPNRSISLPKELNNYKFGAMNQTGTGDGSFLCLVSDNNKAVLLGGFTTMNLYQDEELPAHLAYYKKHHRK